MNDKFKFNKISFKPWSIHWLPVTEKLGGLFPFLFLNDGKPSLVAALYAKTLHEEGWAEPTIKKNLEALGYFYSLCVSKYGESSIPKSDISSLFGEYASKRLLGTYQIDRSDPTGLNWNGVNPSTVKREIDRLGKYSDFAHRYLGFEELNPVDKNATEIFRNYKDLKLQGRSDVMVHLAKQRKVSKKSLFELNPRKFNKKLPRPKYIPLENVFTLIEDGCLQARDKMLVLLMAFGGLRISETLHIYLDDVTGIHKSTQATKVLLNHPGESDYQWFQNGEKYFGKRSSYLMQVFKTLPRNQLGMSHKHYAGWKGMNLIESNANENYIFWLEEIKTGTFFRKLLEEYIQEHKGLILGNRLKHPYLLFNTRKSKSSNYGEALSLDNAHYIFEAACKRVGIDSAPHECRHLFGFYCADILKVPPETLQRLLRHKSITSTDRYYHRSNASIRNEIAGYLDIETDSVYPLKKPEFPTNWTY